ncbi:rRNA pseudouridine synthase [Fusobacterium sp. FSA-380-WT-3A]|nr:pseudouridine synthase [Fusobacterium sp. FSA-380-WT-3A]NME35893.1 rRNA pseudouridine synthase [Fusobacterium sp. FSA-380-WT-3A]
MEKIRINKYLANLGIDSRRAIDKLIEEGKILVNGSVALSGMKVDENDEIIINGKNINKKTQSKKVYFMLNKPQKVLSAVKDDRGRKLVTDLIDTDERIFPIGRLDYDTEGLIILTNDGDIYNRVIHPRGEVFKTYYVEIQGNISMTSLNKIKKGIELDGKMTLPAKAKIISSTSNSTTLNVSIKEGKNRQIRRMFESVGHKVTFLKRIAIGNLLLDEKLKIGDYRPLKKIEINYLYSL